jgi:crotonobetainyl-CoA:carnitine CoA-transferase CaiB-like acyl-CoA transferase
MKSTNDNISLVKKLAEESDVLIENFKPGTMEKWGLGPGKLQNYLFSVFSTGELYKKIM